MSTQAKNVFTTTSVALTQRLMVITPKIAADWLKTSPRNRYIKTWVATLAEMMRNGSFVLTHQGIAFDAHNRLRDGHHRLMAIMESDTTQTMWVAWGLTEEAVEAIDSGKQRSEADSLRIAGTLATRNNVAVGRVMLARGFGTANRATRPEVMAFVRTHLEAIQAVSDVHVSKGVTAAIRAVCGRAWYTQDHDKIDRFLTVMASGVPDGPHERSAAMLRQASLAVGTGTSAQRQDIYHRAQYALTMFLKDKPITRLLADVENRFPIPGDTQ